MTRQNWVSIYWIWQTFTNECLLAWMSKKWTSPVYVFFKPTPDIKYKNGQCCHVFECETGTCKGKNSCYVSCFLDKGDANSTGNLLWHVGICWGTEVVAAATATKDIHTARDVLVLSSEFGRSCRVRSRARRWLQLVGCAALLLDASNFGGPDGVGESGVEPRRSLRRRERVKEK